MGVCTSTADVAAVSSAPSRYLSGGAGAPVKPPLTRCADGEVTPAHHVNAACTNQVSSAKAHNVLAPVARRLARRKERHHRIAAAIAAAAAAGVAAAAAARESPAIRRRRQADENAIREAAWNPSFTHDASLSARSSAGTALRHSTAASTTSRRYDDARDLEVTAASIDSETEMLTNDRSAPVTIAVTPSSDVIPFSIDPEAIAARAAAAAQAAIRRAYAAAAAAVPSMQKMAADGVLSPGNLTHPFAFLSKLSPSLTSAVAEILQRSKTSVMPVTFALPMQAPITRIASSDYSEKEHGNETALPATSSSSTLVDKDRAKSSYDVVQSADSADSLELSAVGAFEAQAHASDHPRHLAYISQSATGFTAASLSCTEDNSIVAATRQTAMKSAAIIQQIVGEEMTTAERLDCLSTVRPANANSLHSTKLVSVPVMPVDPRQRRSRDVKYRSASGMVAVHATRALRLPQNRRFLPYQTCETVTSTIAGSTCKDLSDGSSVVGVDPLPAEVAAVPSEVTAFTQQGQNLYEMLACALRARGVYLAVPMRNLEKSAGVHNNIDSSREFTRGAVRNLASRIRASSPAAHAESLLGEVMEGKNASQHVLPLATVTHVDTGSADAEATAAAAEYVAAASAAVVADNAESYIDAILLAENAAATVIRRVGEGHLITLDEEMASTRACNAGSASLNAPSYVTLTHNLALILQRLVRGHNGRLRAAAQRVALGLDAAPTDVLTSNEEMIIGAQSAREAEIRLCIPSAASDDPDADIRLLHLERFEAYARECNPTFTSALPMAWEKCGTNPMRYATAVHVMVFVLTVSTCVLSIHVIFLIPCVQSSLWLALEDQRPNSTRPFYEGLERLANERMVQREAVSRCATRAVARARISRKRFVLAVATAATLIVTTRVDASAPACTLIDSRNIPINDDDLRPWHYERLSMFANDVAPTLLDTLPVAWTRFGMEPMRIWAAIDKRYPGQTAMHIEDLVAISEERARRRRGDAAREGALIFPHDARLCNSATNGSRLQLADVAPGTHFIRTGMATIPSNASANTSMHNLQHDYATILAAIEQFAPPADDDDLQPIYLARLHLYTSEVAPEAAERVQAAFNACGDQPLLLFASCERQHPDTTNAYVADLIACTVSIFVESSQAHAVF